MRSREEGDRGALISMTPSFPIAGHRRCSAWLREGGPGTAAARRRDRHGPKHRRDERSTVFERPYRHISAMSLLTAIRPCRERQRANESATSNALATGCQRRAAAGPALRRD